MNKEQAATPPQEPTVTYMAVEDESMILDEVFNELFEQLEKEIK